jgi:hypothetical protein
MSAFLLRFRADGLWIGLVLLFYVILLTVVPPTGEFPTIDDFDYAATAWHLADTGQLTLSDWPAMTLVTHVAWGALACKLFGNSFAVLRCSMCVLSAAAGVAIYYGVRQAGHSRPLASLAAVCFAANPLTVSFEYTFMTDVTGAAFSAVLIACAPQPRRTSHSCLVGYSVLAGVAYLARETACIPWIMVLLATAWACVRRRASWLPLIWLVAPTGFMIGLYQHWLREFAGVPYNRSQPSLEFGAILHDLQRPLYMVTGLALSLAPLALVAFAVLCRNTSGRWWLLPVAVGLFGAALVCIGINIAPPYRDELFDLGLRLPESPIGRIPESLSGPATTRFGPEVSLVRAAATGAAWLCTVALGVALVQRRRNSIGDGQPSATPIPIATMTALSMAGLYLVTPGFSDRYLLSLVPAAILMLAEQLPPQIESRTSLWLGWSGATLIAVASLIGIQDSMVRSRAFFTAADHLRTLGADPFDVDAGIAYGGMYRFNPLYRGEANRGPFWSAAPPIERSTMMASVHPLTTTLNRKYRISFDDEFGYRPIEVVPYESWFRKGDVRIYERGVDRSGRL